MSEQDHSTGKLVFDEALAGCGRREYGSVPVYQADASSSAAQGLLCTVDGYGGMYL